jgi:hypothetical protein
MADYILRVLRKESDEHVVTYKLTGIATAVSAYTVFAHYEANHCSPEHYATIEIVERDYPFWDSFDQQKEFVAS